MTSLYIHIPFCVKKCPYCAFRSAPPASGDEAVFLRAVDAALSRRAPVLAHTLYFGGGTPSLLSIDAWRELFDIVDRHAELAPDAEVTIEVNPSSLTASHLELWRERGAGRISIGAQSFDDGELRFLGRAHDARRTADAVRASVRADLSVSVDLIFGLPIGTLRGWMGSLRTALSLGADHISIYQLTIEPDTPFASRGLELPEGYAEYRLAQWYLARKGLAQYEVANFAREGRESRHNLNYWSGGEYIGVGPGASSFVDGERSENIWPLGAYAESVLSGGSGIASSERLDRGRAAREAAVLALRTSRGIEWKVFSDRYGADAAETIRAQLRAFPADLVCSGETSTKLTPRGMRLANAIWREIV